MWTKSSSSSKLDITINVFLFFEYGYFTNPLVVQEFLWQRSRATQAARAQAASFGRTAPIAATLETRGHSDEANEGGSLGVVVMTALKMESQVVAQVWE